MSISHRKVLNSLKDYLKSPHDKNFFFILNKEWLSFLQKLPTLYASQESNDKISTVLKSDVSIPTKLSLSDVKKESTPTTVSVETNTKDSSQYSLPDVINGLKERMNLKQTNGITEESITAWKSKDVVSQISITSRTKHVISSINSAETVLSRLKRLDDLINHVKQYPEAKHLAVQEGAIRLLLKLRQNVSDEETHAVIREAFAVLGFTDPLPRRGIRILTMDGGGIRGVIAIELLKKLEELTGKKVHELFDFICGVSTGAILVGVLGAQRKSLDEVSFLYKTLSTKIFNQNALWGMGQLAWSHAYYDTSMWEQLLKENVGELPMIKTTRDPKCPKLAAVSAVVNQPRVKPFVFRNYTLPCLVQSQYNGSYEYSLWQAARASAAAPSYFEEYKLGEYLHQDGGILVNNPTAVAIHEARLLWPENPLQCVISLGTGRFNPMETKQPNPSNPGAGASSWKTKFLKILDSATDTEAVHTCLNDLLPKNVYYRFNPYITEMIAMDEIRPVKISQLEMDAEMYFRRNEETFRRAAAALVEPPTISQKITNWVNYKKLLYGLRF